MAQTREQMVLVAFLQAQECSNYPYSWRHPASMMDFTTPEYYQRIARTLEDGKFDLAFFDDRLAMPDLYGGDYADAVRNGVRSVKMDLIPLLAFMGAATTHLGLGGTYSTTYYEPFHIARVFATLDLMLKGRAAWNVVTSLNDAETVNFGREERLEHDDRYDRADEFMEVVLGHWDTWEPDAIAGDKNGTFADPAKVHRLDHRGRWFKSRGPFTVPRSQQGHPVIIQAGQSGRGRAFAGRWAELIFTLAHSLELAQLNYRGTKEQIAAAGRDPACVAIAPLVTVVVGETRRIVDGKMELFETLSRPVDGLVVLSEILNFDLGSKPLDEPFNDDELASISGLQSLRNNIIRLSGKANPSVADFLAHTRKSTIHEGPLFAGTPAEVVDGLEQWFKEEACDGFVLGATHRPGGYEDFVRLVIPELQRRGLFRREYAGSTLREHLGLPMPAPGDWKKTGAKV